jgi:hypothetical protein
MSTMSHYRPSKRPSVKDVSKWYNVFQDTIKSDWKGPTHKHVMIEQGYPFPDFYRVTYTIEGVKKSKLFYGETAWNKTEMFVYDMGFRNILGRI